MFDFVTQRDIDALFRAGKGAANPAPPEVVAWSLSPAPLVGKDDRAALEPVLARFARDFGTLLTARLQIPVEVAPLAIDCVPCREFVLALESPCASLVFRLDAGLAARGVLELGPDVAFHLLDRLLGGPGESAVLRRPLTSLEQSVVRTAAEGGIQCLRAAWNGTLPFGAEPEQYLADPERVGALLGDGDVLVAHLELRDEAFRGSCAVALPAKIVAETLPAAGLGVGPQAGRAAMEPAVEAGLMHARLGVTARLPQFRISARALAGLKPGQILHTQQPVDGALEIHVNGQLRFLGSLGQIRQHVGVRIVRGVESPAVEPPPRIRQGRVS